MDRENNLPTFFNCFLFFLGAALFVLAGKAGDRTVKRPWYVLALVFVFLGIDEGAQVHEQFMLVTLRLIGWQQGRMGWLYYAWVIPYGIAAALLGVYLLRFLVRLPVTTRNGLVLSGTIYVVGAVVMESLSGKIAEAAFDTDLPSNLAYCMTVTLEESLEMVGLILCIHTMLVSLASRSMVMAFHLRPDTSAEADRGEARSLRGAHEA
jgi:MFS family permease